MRVWALGEVLENGERESRIGEGKSVVGKLG